MKNSYLLFIMAIISCVSCTNKEDSQVQYIPFQESENSLWGMISPAGEVLF